jgi:hypothetical protein
MTVMTHYRLVCKLRGNITMLIGGTPGHGAAEFSNVFTTAALHPVLRQQNPASANKIK